MEMKMNWGFQSARKRNKDAFQGERLSESERKTQEKSHRVILSGEYMSKIVKRKLNLGLAPVSKKMPKENAKFQPNFSSYIQNKTKRQAILESMHSTPSFKPIQATSHYKNLSSTLDNVPNIKTIIPKGLAPIKIKPKLQHEASIIQLTNSSSERRKIPYAIPKMSLHEKLCNKLRRITQNCSCSTAYNSIEKQKSLSILPESVENDLSEQLLAIKKEMKAVLDHYKSRERTLLNERRHLLKEKLYLTT